MPVAELITQSASGFKVTQEWIAQDYASMEAARAAVDAAAPATFTFNGEVLDKLPAEISVQNAVDDVALQNDYRFSVIYGQEDGVQPPVFGAGDLAWSFSIGGGSTHITRGTYVDSTGTIAEKQKGVIGATKEGVAGLDIPNNAFAFQIRKVYIGGVTEAFVAGLKQYVGKVNSDAFKSHAAGEVLCLGISSGDIALGADCEITYQFAAQENVTGETLPGGLPGTYDKLGWDYLELVYSPQASQESVNGTPTGGDKLLIHAPTGAQIIKIRKEIAFAGLGL